MASRAYSVKTVFHGKPNNFFIFEDINMLKRYYIQEEMN